MKDRCTKLSRDMEGCQGELGQFNRCVWYHGEDSKDSSHESKHNSKDMKEDIEPRLGCIWDQTGCANGCDMEAMDQRCDRMSHDQEMCEGEIGAFNRCVWSHGSNSHMNVDIHFSNIGEDSTVDILLIIAGVVTAVFIIQQFYKWWRNREYKKVQGTQHHEEIQITSHAV